MRVVHDQRSLPSATSSLFRHKHEHTYERYAKHREQKRHKFHLTQPQRFNAYYQKNGGKEDDKLTVENGRIFVWRAVIVAPTVPLPRLKKDEYTYGSEHESNAADLHCADIDPRHTDEPQHDSDYQKHVQEPYIATVHEGLHCLH